MLRPSLLGSCLAGLLFLGGAPAAWAATLVTDEPLQQNWIKRGLVFPLGFAGEKSSKFVSSPSVIRLKDGRLRAYIWVADDGPPWMRGNQVIIAAESDPANPFVWKVISDQPMVGRDASSTIRDIGAGFPYVLPRDDGPWLMYYGSWGGNWPLKQELLNRLGTAVSHDQGLTWEVVNEDTIPSGPPGSFDSGAIPSAAVIREGENDYRMWYTAAGKYLRFGDINQGILHIGAARSSDGLHWTKLDEPALLAREDATEPYEACLARPYVLKLDGVYHMWLGVYDKEPGSRPNPPGAGDSGLSAEGAKRTGSGHGSYRIEYARSDDGITWTRYADQPIMPLTPGGFDENSHTYVSVVDMGEQLWMFYTGDGLGATGVGLATLDKSELQANP